MEKLKEKDEEIESLLSKLDTKESELEGLLKSVEAVCNKVSKAPSSGWISC